MMKKVTLFMIAAVALVGTSAFAQIATGSGVAGVGSGGVVEITVRGILVSSVKLDISGSGTTALSATTSATNPTAAVGTLDFGTFSTQTPAAATQTTFAGRTTAGTAGAIVAGTLSATLTFSGATSGTVRVSRKVAAGATPDIPANNLRVASPALASWPQSTSGLNIPDPGTSVDICTGALGACTSATPYLHQLAVFVPDTQASGAFSSVVTYSGTAL